MSREQLAALVTAGLAVLAASCAGGGSPTSQSNSLDNQVCTEEDLGGEFRQATSGDFSGRNLADLSDHPRESLKQFQDTGLQRGRFTYWKHLVSDPPFDPPVEAVCQVLEFANDQQASQFLAALEARPESAATTAIAWLPDSLSAAEVPAEALGLPPGTRAFRLQGRDAAGNLTVFAVLVPAERYVRSIYIGDLKGKASLNDAAAIQQRIIARLR